MFDRIEGKSDVSLRQMKHAYYDYLRYWRGVLKKYKPDAIIFGIDIPHTVFNYVLYSLAKEYGVKTIMYKRTKGITPERLLFFEDYQKYDDIKTAYDVLKEKDFGQDDLSSGMSEYYKNQKNRFYDATPFYQKSSYMKKSSSVGKIFPSLDSIFKNIKQFTFLKTFFSYCNMYKRRVLFHGLSEKKSITLFEKKRQQVILNKKTATYKKKYLDLVNKNVDFTQKYVYVPLHYQPEASTLPLGDVYDDQVLMIGNLSAALPEGWKIYVKENIIQWKRPRASLGRYYNYYDQILSHKNLELLSPHISSFELFQSCRAVATVTGTAAWEGILRKKPALLFGYTWFMDCEGVFSVDGVESCKRALEKIEEGYSINEDHIIKFLGAIEKVSIKGYAHSRFASGADITEEENVKNIVDKLVEKLDM